MAQYDEEEVEALKKVGVVQYWEVVVLLLVGEGVGT